MTFSIKHILLISVVVSLSMGFEMSSSNETENVYPFDDYAINEFIKNLNNGTKNPSEVQSNCSRTCGPGDARICYYYFFMESYTAMGPACNNCAAGVPEDCFNDQCVMADGVERGIMTVNRKIPGTGIMVCENDTVVVDVINNAAGADATIHWHGILQRDTQYMDGVPFVTQCPILPYATFRYKFLASNSGTHFYHSHTGHHKAEGIYGAVIIRSESEYAQGLYDFDLDEHIFVLSDWTHKNSEFSIPGLPTTAPGLLPDGILIGGQGRWNNTITGQRTNTTYKLINVRKGFTYLFRLIGAASNVCPIQYQIENHNMTVIGVDGDPCKPREINTLVIHAGNRYDVSIKADQEEKTYWIQCMAIGACARLKIMQFALLSYTQPDGALYADEPAEVPAYGEFPENVILNSPNILANDSNHLKITDLESLNYEESMAILTATPDITMSLKFDNIAVSKDFIYNGVEWPNYLNSGADNLLVGVMNNISSQLPSSPYLSQAWDIDNSSLCNEFNRPAKCANQTICSCNHYIEVPLNSLMEIKLIDLSTAPSVITHPIHVHGHKFHAIAMGQTINGVIPDETTSDIDRTNYIASLNSTISLDTIAVPSAGYVILRFYANNPGMWMIHCHVEHHANVGMFLVMKVGEKEDLPSPPCGFPKCLNYFFNQ